MSDTQQKLDNSVLKEILQHNPTIAGVKIRPITLASIALLKQLKSPLIEGTPFEEIENIILDCAIFLKVQSCDIKESTKLAFGDPSDLVAEALELADKIDPSKIKDVVASIVTLLQDATSTKTEVVADDTKEKDAESLMAELTGKEVKQKEEEGNS